MGFLLVAGTRRCEFAADAFAARELSRGAQLGSALVKLQKDNLSFPLHDALFAALFHDHPSVAHRLEYIAELEKRQL